MGKGEAEAERGKCRKEKGEVREWGERQKTRKGKGLKVHKGGGKREIQGGEKSSEGGRTEWQCGRETAPEGTRE